MQAQSLQMKPDVFGRIETAQKLGVCKRTLDHYIARRQIGFVKLGALVKFRQCDIDAFVARHVIPARPTSGVII